jgi:hypothetical protein
VIFEQLKSINGDVIWNLLKKQQNLIDCTPITLTTYPSPSPSHSPPFNEFDAPSVGASFSYHIKLTTLKEFVKP